MKRDLCKLQEKRTGNLYSLPKMNPQQRVKSENQRGKCL
ncbi:hypothetical protein HMPREF1508_0918 [Shuttleworthella sp. MSX8B]|nr:hypothetical protein HMPREF1508_0918 [Shuttleworthia sp. MSX8B]